MNFNFFQIQRFFNRIKWKLSSVNEKTYESFIENIDSARHPEVKTIDETIDVLTNEKKSIARYGDGEYFLCFGRNIGFQHKDKTLQKRLIEVLTIPNPNCVIGIPEFRKNRLTYFWKQFWFENFKLVTKLLNPKITYFNQSISREINLEQIKSLSQLWENKHVVFVTGKGSRFNPEHEIFKNVSSYDCVYGQPKNAWQDYNRLLNEITEKAGITETIVILAIGPTATILAYDLSNIQNVQAIDIGHITNVYDRIVYGTENPEKLAINK